MASDDKESFIETTFDFADYNQTWDFNNTNLEHFLCHHEHFESLVRICEVSWKIAFLNILPRAHFQTNFSGCLPKHDQILCWPPTLRNSLSVQPCFKEWNGVLYDNTEGE